MLLPKHTAYLGTQKCIEAGANHCIIKPIGQVGTFTGDAVPHTRLSYRAYA